MQIVPLTDKTKLLAQVAVATCALAGQTKLVAQVVVASCAPCAKTKYCAQKAQNRGTTSATLALVVQIVPCR